MARYTSRLPFLGRQVDFAGGHREPSRSRIAVEFPRHLRHDPQLLKILFAEDRNVRPALMILSQFDTKSASAPMGGIMRLRLNMG